MPRQVGQGRSPAFRLTPEDVGRRVVVRHRVPAGLTDVLGVLESWAAGTLTVRRKDGSVVTVEVAAVVAAKVVPDASVG